jgi:hypothetical protein
MGPYDDRRPQRTYANQPMRPCDDFVDDLGFPYKLVHPT